MTDDPAGFPTIYSIGHANRSSSDFVAQLRAAGVRCVVDVRAYPASRRHPQFTRMMLEPVLRGEGMRYQWEGQALGGMRSARAESPHIGLTDPAMRGFADHMASRDFGDAISRLLKQAADTPIALMCAERDPRHCHRALIADALLLAGAEVRELIDLHDVRGHALNAGARVAADGSVTYDACIQMGLALR